MIIFLWIGSKKKGTHFFFGELNRRIKSMLDVLKTNRIHVIFAQIIIDLILGRSMDLRLIWYLEIILWRKEAWVFDLHTENLVLDIREFLLDKIVASNVYCISKKFSVVISTTIIIKLFSSSEWCVWIFKLLYSFNYLFCQQLRYLSVVDTHLFCRSTTSHHQ
jgi:hypothetical protein